MVTNVTSLTGNGLKDWLIQRVTAIYLGFYAIYIAVFIGLHPHMDFAHWHALFQCRLWQAASIVALFAFILHAWIGIWTVTTDYLKNTLVRLLIQSSVLLFLVIQFIWGSMIVWGH